MDLRLVELETRRVRRVPVQGGGALAGCFSQDRTRLYATAMDFENAGMAIFEINLSTGENRRIAADGLPDGFAIGPALSPDGRKLAVIMLSMDRMSQLYVVDLKTSKARKLGSPMDTAFLSWLEDGSGLILVTRKHVSMDLPGEDSVARMDLQGSVTVLVKGTHPVLIPGRNRILFQQQDEWKTCSVDGTQVELYAGGMKGYGFPAVSADGRRIVWIRFHSGRLPVPVSQEFGKTEIEELNLGPGAWTLPVWK